MLEFFKKIFNKSEPKVIINGYRPMPGKMPSLPKNSVSAVNKQSSIQSLQIFINISSNKRERQEC